MAADKRKKQIALIHIGKDKLGLDDDAYRAFLGGVCGKDSAADMTVKELELALRNVRAVGIHKRDVGGMRAQQERPCVIYFCESCSSCKTHPIFE